jgi:hypothetical protein
MKTLVFFYTYRLGGWGDLIKGLHTCWCWAKATDRELKINFQHHIFGSIFPQYASGFTNTNLRVDINAIDQVGSVTVDRVKALEEQNEIIVLCNWFSPDSIGDVDPFPFYKELYSTIFPLPRIVQEQPYYVLHFRLVDKYLTEATACKVDDRIKSFGRIGTIIEQYKALGHPRTLVCSDNASIIKKLLATIPNSFTICPNPYHIAYPSKELHTKLEDILKIIQEHRAMTESAGIYMMSYSGFPITAGLIGSVDLQIWSEDCKLSAYSDSMVQGLKLLLNTNREQ